MISVKGIYEGGNIVKIDGSELQVAYPYEVMISFLRPVKKEIDEEAQRQKAFEGLMKFHRILTEDIDYKKELSEGRDERYGSVD